MGRRRKKRRSPKRDDELRAECMANLMELLTEYDGSTKHPSVVNSVTKLSKLNPTEKPARSDLLLGKFNIVSAPNFPGRIIAESDDGAEYENAHVFKYTLGKMSFGVFQPHAMECTLRQVYTDIQIKRDGTDDTKLLSYPLISDLIIHTPNGDLSATLRNRADSYVKSDDRLTVDFQGSTLSPSAAVLADDELFSLWKETFAQAYTKADREGSKLSTVFRYILRIALKMTTPSDEDAERREDNSFSFEMKRAPRGYYDVLYLDEEIRISRGNRGTIVIMRREVDEQESV
jgi:hypothetical protein